MTNTVDTVNERLDKAAGGNCALEEVAILLSRMKQRLHQYLQSMHSLSIDCCPTKNAELVKHLKMIRMI